MKYRATVAVVEWNWGGHNHTYFKHFTSALAGCGAFVVPVMSEPTQFQSMQAGGLGEWSGSVADPIDFRPSEYLKIRPSRLSIYVRTWSTFRRLGKALRDWERRQGRPIDMVFFACMYDHDFPQASLVGQGLRRPWAGLYLQGRVFHQMRHEGAARVLRQARKTFGCRWMAAIGVLEPSVLELATLAIPNINAKLFPDILEPIAQDVSVGGSGVLSDLRSAAGGRPVVSLLGHLQPSKGLELFLRAACDPRLDGVAFFLGGSLDLRSFAAESRHRVEQLMKRAPHLHCRLERLGEAEFNAAVSGSDILFAAYVDFPYSSNVQGKAAQMNKPMIVTEGGLMAERCRQYQLGECVPQNDLESVVAAILKILAERGSPEGRTAAMALHADYVAQHGHHAVGEAMEWMLRCLHR